MVVSTIGVVERVWGKEIKDDQSGVKWTMVPQLEHVCGEAQGTKDSDRNWVGEKDIELGQ